MTAQDYPLAKDPKGPYDVTIVTYNMDGVRYCFRSPWRVLPTLRDCHAYVIHGKTWRCVQCS